MTVTVYLRMCWYYTMETKSYSGAFMVIFFFNSVYLGLDLGLGLGLGSDWEVIL